jgi:hypothetical protein
LFEENHVIIKHYFEVEIFFLLSLTNNYKNLITFSEQTINLLSLSCTLNSEGNYKAFNIDTVCTLVENIILWILTSKRRLMCNFNFDIFQKNFPKKVLEFFLEKNFDLKNNFRVFFRKKLLIFFWEKMFKFFCWIIFFSKTFSDLKKNLFYKFGIGYGYSISWIRISK